MTVKTVLSFYPDALRDSLSVACNANHGGR